MATSEYRISVPNLLAWGESIKLRAQMAWDGEGEFVPGDHCQFCRIKGKCKARANLMMEIAQRYDRAKAAQLTAAEIADILQHADAIAKWAADVQEHALEQARDHGVRYPGFKLVEGRSNRVYCNRDEMVARLLQEGYSTADIYRAPELLGLTDMEKLLGKKTFAELLGDYVTKPQGKATLVPAADKRPELTSSVATESDFDEVD